MKIERSTIHLKDMKFYAYHGVLPEERKLGGWYTVSVEMELNDNESFFSDNIYDTVDYSMVYDTIEQEMAEPSDLIEYVAGRIATSILEEFEIVERISVSVQKDAPPIKSATMSGSIATITAHRD